MTRAASLVAIVALAACRDRAAAPPAPEPLPPGPVPLDLGREPIVNPLNLWDLLIEGAPDHETVGVVAGAPVTTRELDARTGQVLTRIGDRIYLARDAGWRWLVEREGLARAAAAAGQSIPALLAGGVARLPLPDDPALAPYLARDDVAAVPEAERRAAATTMWRWDAWAIRRSVLVARGLDGVAYGRLQLMLVSPKLAGPDVVVAELGDRKVTRRELHEAAGYAEQLARREYVEAARLAFDELARERLLDAEAGRRGVDRATLIAEVERGVPPPTDADVDAWIAERPEYATAPNGRGRAREDVWTLRKVAAVDALVAGLRVAHGVTFHLRPSPFEPLPPRLDAPRRHGAPGAPHVLEVLHCAGTATCALGTALAAAIADAAGDRLRIEAGDYFERPRLATVRGALAMRCAEEQGRGWALGAALARADAGATLAALDRAAAEARVDPAALRACVATDRWLPTIAEDVARAQVLGLELNVAGLWLDGERLERLDDPAALVADVVERVQR